MRVIARDFRTPPSRVLYVRLLMGHGHPRLRSDVGVEMAEHDVGALGLLDPERAESGSGAVLPADECRVVRSGERNLAGLLESEEL